LKEITGNSKGTIDQNCRKAKKQSENIIFDITNSLLSDDEVLKQLDIVVVQYATESGMGILLS